MLTEISFTDYFIGTVILRDTSNKKLGVYIPKLMPMIYGGSINERKGPVIQSNSDKYDVKFNKNITTSNYIWVKPLDAEVPLPLENSKVLIYFLDGNPQTPVWAKFNSNNDYLISDEDKYQTLYKFNDIEIKNDSNIKVNLPEFFDIEYVNKNGELNLNIKMNEIRFKEYLETLKEENDEDIEEENKTDNFVLRNITIAPEDWEEDDTYISLPYRAIIINGKSTRNTVTSVTFHPDENMDDLSNFTTSDNGKIYIYAKTEILTDVKIILIKGEIYGN